MDKDLIIIIGVIGFLLILCFLLAIASFSGDKFFDEYKRLLSKNTQTTNTVSLMINRLNSNILSNKVKIIPINRTGGDFYNAKQKVVAVNLNSEASLSTFAVIAHEMGHAYQDIVENKLKKFNKLRMFGSIIGKLFLPILIVGVVLLFLVENYFFVLIGTLLTLAFIVFLAIIIKSKTIKIEKNASEIGINFLKDFLTEDELKDCKKLLNSARLTYWADLIKLLLGWSGLTNKTQMFK